MKFYSMKNNCLKINGGNPLDDEICKLIQSIQTNSIVRSLAFHPNGNILAFGTDDKTIKICSIHKNGISETNPLQVLTGHTSSVDSLAYHPTGNILVSGSNQLAKLWKISPDGTWDRTPPQNLPHNNMIWSVGFNHNGTLLACGLLDFKVNLWRINPNGTAEGKPCFYLTGHNGPVYTIAFHPYLNLLASGSDDSVVKIWNINPNGYWDGIDLPRIRTHSKAVICVAFSPNGTLLATGSKDKTVALYKFPWEESYLVYPLETLTSHEGHVRCLAFHPSSNFLASGSTDNTVIIWKINPNGMVDINPFQILRGHVSGICCLSFNPSGNILVTGSMDKTVKIWNCTKLSTHWPRLELLTTGNLSAKLLASLTIDPTQTLSTRLGNHIRKRIGIVPDTFENRKKENEILGKKYVELPRTIVVDPPQPSVALTHMSEHIDASLAPRPRESLVQLKPAVAIMDTPVSSQSIVCREDDTDCNAVYNTKFWDIVVEMHSSCTDSSEILKKIEELKGYKALLEKQGKPTGITAIWINKLEKKIKACKK